MLEVYGQARCPFSFRVRLAAAEKGVPFEWLPFDVPEPDSRALRNNPDRRSPLAIHDGFRLTESLVIAQYVDEAFPGRPLAPTDPKERARMRLAIAELAPFERLEGTTPDATTTPAADRAFHTLERRLAMRDAPWLGGSALDLADILVIPMIAALVEHGHAVPADAARARAYFERAEAHPTVVATRP